MFTAKERRIFRFHNGERVVARDPRQVFLKLQATMPANYDILAQQLDESDKAIDETLPEHEKRELATKNAAAVLNAEETLGKWIANAFNVKVMDYDGNGMTYDELVALDIEFHEFFESGVCLLLGDFLTSLETPQHVCCFNTEKLRRV